ncbi:MAG: beta-glucuronidase, partial [Chitinophagaceae bacterium]
MFKRKAGILFLFVLYAGILPAQSSLIANIPSRKTTDLNGAWQYIIDRYETGFYDYRYRERQPADNDAYWNPDTPVNKTARKEYGYSDKYTLRVPGDWNSQDPG